MKMGRKASLEKGEQTVETNHPVDGLPERICGPPSGVETELEFPKKLPVHCAETVNGGETESSVILLFQMKKMKKAADCQLVADGPRFYYRLQYDRIPGSVGGR